MRLTLRTLLAYQDDILDPADQEELGRKIEGSDFATELIHRTRDVVRRLRLGAPSVLDTGGDSALETVSATDANVVSEYLDNTLPAEDVADFERICLEPGNEADMHLAEVASCHHVLTMVLGEPAEIDSATRQRMYELPENQASGGQKLRIEPAHSAHQQSPPQPTVSDVTPPPMAPVGEAVVSEVPDYLRAASVARKRGRRWVMVAGLLFVAGAGFLMMGGLMTSEPPAEVAELDASASELVIESEQIDEAGTPAESQTLAEQLESEAPEFVPDTDSVDSGDPASLPDELQPSSPETLPEEELSEQPVLAEPQVSESADLEPVDLDTDFPEVPSESPDAESSDLANLPPQTPPTELPGEEEAAESAEMSDTDEPLLVASAGDLPEEGSLVFEEEAVPEEIGPVQIGSYLGNNDVLLRHDAVMDKWVRLPPRSSVSSGDSLLALPTYRVHVVLADVNTYLSGGTRIELLVKEAALGAGETDLELSVIYGRVLLNSGLNGSSVALRLNDEVRQIQLTGSSSLAVEVQRVFVPGSNNEQDSSPIEARWFLTSGSVDWSGAAGESQTIEAPATWSTIDGSDDLPRAIDDLPEWIDREQMTDLQRRARVTLAEELTPSEPVGIRLLELNDQREKGRRSEVRTLAAEASVHVGEFEPFAKALSDKDQRRAWRTHIVTLRQALARSPDVAKKVYKAFADLRGEQAADELMEMVAGYDRAAIGETPEAIQEGAVVTLIRRLESDSLDYRVLAIYNLNEIMGTTSLKGFRADDSSQRRKIAVAKIWDSFQSNELVPTP